MKKDRRDPDDATPGEAHLLRPSRYMRYVWEIDACSTRQALGFLPERSSNIVELRVSKTCSKYGAPAQPSQQLSNRVLRERTLSTAAPIVQFTAAAKAKSSLFFVGAMKSN